LEDDVVIKDDRSLLKTGWLTIQLDNEMKRIIKASSQKKSYFYIEDPESNEIKEINADSITTLYDQDAHLTQMQVVQKARVLMKNENRQTMVSADIIEMNFDGPTGKTTGLKIPTRGKVENIGKTRFKVIADDIKAKYNDAGEINYCEGNGNVKFIIEDYQGISNKMSYDIQKDTIILLGEDSQLIHNNNTFTASQFNVKVKEKQLSSKTGVKSLIQMERENALFSIDPIYINSIELTIFEKENKFIYKQQVNLTQGETNLTANNIEITENNSVLAQGRVYLAFKKGEKEIAILGGKLTFDPEQELIRIEDNARIESGETILRAASFDLHFNEKKEVDQIIGKDNIYFSKDELTGKSRRAQWLFSQDVLVLKGGPPEIINRNGGKTTGKELKINLNDNKITILSDQYDRTETVITE